MSTAPTTVAAPVELAELPARIPRDEPGRSPWVASEAELVARARVHLLDTGMNEAPHMPASVITSAWLLLAAEARELGREPLEHAEILKAEHRARITAPECGRCGARRPTFLTSRGWGSIDGHAACPRCLKVHRLLEDAER